MKMVTVLREAKGWNRSELARQSGLHRSQITLFESGRMVPYASQLAKLAAALGVDRSVDLLAEAESEPPTIAQ